MRLIDGDKPGEGPRLAVQLKTLASPGLDAHLYHYFTYILF